MFIFYKIIIIIEIYIRTFPKFIVRGTHLPNLLPHLQIIPLDNPRRQIHHHHHRSVPDAHIFLYFHAIAIPEPENIRNLHLIIDKMDLPVLHCPSIQPVIKKRLVSAAFKRKRNQIPLDRQILPVSDFFTNLYMQLDDSSQVRIIMVLDMAAIIVIKYRNFFATNFQYSLINHDNKISSNQLW